ncbi:MAG: PfkB family carbohydrate kinase [Planctomycetota bacterium]
MPPDDRPSSACDVSQKIVTHAQLLDRRRAAREAGRTVVVCHGCFDIVHPGHIRHLRQAKAMGDELVVSVTGDAQISKGQGRPLIPQELRAENLAALDLVDWVCIDERPTALELLRELAPDVYIKGREYESNGDPRFQAEREAVEAAGGRIVFSSGDVVFSSTALIGSLEQSTDPFHARLCGLLRDPALSDNTLSGVVDRFRGVRVTIVGEPIIDSYVLCDRPEVASESPVMALRPLETRRYDGGAAVIARHIASMGGSATLVTALPESEKADAFVRRLRADGVEVLWLPVSNAIPEKQRYVVGGQKVMRVDHVEPYVLDAGERDALIGLAIAAGRADAAILTNFGLGLLTRTATRKLISALRPGCPLIAGDVSGPRGDLLAFRDIDLVTPSEHELRASMHVHDEALPAVAAQLLQGGSIGRAIVTMGADGAIGFEPLPAGTIADDTYATRLKADHVPSLAPAAIDALGCGDALLAAATLTLHAGGSMLAATFLGAVAAAAQARRFGNLPVSATDLRRNAAQLHRANVAFAPADELDAQASVRRAS